MEVKINREIRNYTESMFFGLSLRQFVFFFTGCRRCGAFVLCFEALCGDGNGFVDVHPWCCALCGNGLCELQRYDRRAICVGMAPQRNAGAQADQIRAGEYLLRGVEGRYR